MELKLVILGFLKRFGPLHGYELKEKIANEVSDFVNVKLSNVYYHLEKLHEEGYLESEKDISPVKKEIIVFSINKRGLSLFHELLEKLLIQDENIFYKDDVILFFADEYSENRLIQYFNKKLENENYKHKYILNHRKLTLKYLPENYRKTADAVFRHSIIHTEAEIKWCNEVIKLFQGEKNE